MSFRELAEQYEQIHKGLLAQKNCFIRRLESGKLDEEGISKNTHELDQTEGQLKFLRPPTEDDYEYRERTMNKFDAKVFNLIKNEDNLLFHGTPIFNVEGIMKSGNLSSGVDRHGGKTCAFNEAGEISVTGKRQVEIPLKYSGLNPESEFNNHFPAGGCLPAGCVFVIKANNSEEWTKADSTYIMPNVDFAQNPERLHSIITTPENIELLNGYARQFGVDPSKIHDYASFVAMLEMQKQQAGGGASPN